MKLGLGGELHIFILSWAALATFRKVVRTKGETVPDKVLALSAIIRDSRFMKTDLELIRERRA